MEWFAKSVKLELERRGFTVFKSENYAFDFIAINPKGKKMGVKCQAHGHLNKPERKKLLSLGILMYVASEKYVTDSRMHKIKIEEVIL